MTLHIHHTLRRFGWYGTLTTLRAGRMYVVTSAQEGILTYAGEGECV